MVLLEIYGLAITGLALVLNIVGVAIPYWFYSSLTIQGQTGSIHFGLWKKCTYFATEGGVVSSVCTIFDEIKGHIVPVAIHAARGLEILAILATTVAIVAVCKKIFYKKENNRLLYKASPIPLLAGLLMITGAVVFVADNEAKKEAESKNPLLHFKPHAAFGLCIVSGILSIVASPILFFAARSIPDHH